MALSVDYSTVAPWLITIPKSDLTLITGTQYQLTVDEYWLLLRDFTDNENSMAKPKLYSRIPATSSTPSITTIEETYYELQFEDGLYSVNIINGNTNIREIEVKNQVSVNTNNTTGFIDPIFLQSATFIGKEGLGVSLSPATGTDGISYPTGIREFPCKTITNAHDIAEDRGFKNIYVKDSLNIDISMTDSYTFFGDNPQVVNINCAVGSDVSNAKFQDCYITGKLDSTNIVWESIVGSITNSNGFIYKSTIIGPVVVSGTLSMEDCWTATPGTDNIIDFNSTANTVAVTDWSGGTILVKNMVAGCLFGMGGTAGSLKLDSSCTGGSINHGGAIRIKEDLSTGTTINDASTATQVLSESMTEDYPVDGQSAMSLEQAVYSINQALTEFQRTAASISVKKRDATTEAYEITLDDATAPTSATQSS